MSKLIKITLGIALAFLIVGCESSEAKSSSNSTQARQVEQQQVATQTNQMSEEQKYKILATGALEYIQNTPFENYQNTTFKQMLDKWTNFCASVEWDIVRVTALDSKKNSGNFMVTAYCKIKDFEATKTYLQSHYTQKGYVDFSFNHLGRFNPVGAIQRDEIKSFLGGSKLYPLIPSGGELIIEKMNENQKRKTFNYIMDKIYMPLSQAINESTKIYIAYPFLVKGSCEYDDLGNAKCAYNAEDTKWTALLTRGNSFFIHRDYSMSLKDFHIALEVGGKKLFVINNREYNEKEIDMQELMFFNKSVDIISFMEKTIIPRIVKNDFGGKSKARNVSILTDYREFCEYYEKDTQVCDLMLSTPAIKKILYDKQEQEQFFKDFASEIVKIYSEAN